MISAAQFKNNVEHKGATGRLKSPGRIALITAALEAYEQACQMRAPDDQQLAYLYEVYKQCKAWLEAKADKDSTKTGIRRQQVMALKREWIVEMNQQFPSFLKALRGFEGKKAQSANSAPKITAGPQGVYAHESAMFQGAKASGNFHDPGASRFAPSATLLHANKDQLGGRSHQGHKSYVANNLGSVEFKDLTEQEFRKLDACFRNQYKVLYMSKIQRLKYMVLFENGLANNIDGVPITLGSGRVLDDLNSCPYAVDKYGNFFVTTSAAHQGTQINHTTLCAGNEVQCAGMISIKNGVVRGLSNNSGHYTPDTARLTQVVQLLQDAGCDLSKMVVVDNKGNGNQIEANGSCYVNGQYGPDARANKPLMLNRIMYATT